MADKLWAQQASKFVDKYGHVSPAPDKKLPDALVISVPLKSDSNDTHTWTSGVVGTFEITTTYSAASNTLTNTTVSILIPGKGPVVVYNSVDKIDLLKPVDIAVSIPNASLSGKVKFSYVTEANKQYVGIEWKGVKAFTKDELAAIKRAPVASKVKDHFGQELLVPQITAQLAEQQSVAATFIYDNVAPGSKVVALESVFGQRGRQGGIDITFHNVFQLIGNIEVGTFTINADLYLSLPFFVKFKLAHLEGSLSNDKTKSIAITIDSDIGKGKGVLYLGTGNKAALYVDLSVDLKWSIKIDLTEVLLVNLP
ncbi:hypothetical protein H0H93_009499, partial [Arthromyces matolae]